MIRLLKDKRILLGVTGSIAAYKSADLASKLTQAGAQVDVVMTQSAQRFITPLAFQSVTGRAVYTDLWAGPDGQAGLPSHIAHVGLGEGADAILIAPATANSMAKWASGSADDLLSVTLLAARCPVIFAPAMDGSMYDHPATQANIKTLMGYGYHLIEPDYGRFASGLEGRGRLPDTPTLIGHLRRILSQSGPLAGKLVVVSAGGTREALDPVRFIGNHSSGKQGYAIAQAALDAGAKVTLITSSRHLTTPVGATLIEIDSAAQLQAAVFAHIESNALIMAAAVADLRPANASEQKIKKGEASLTLELARNDDILKRVGEQRNASGFPKVVVGFAAETQNLFEHAGEKLAKKNLDMIVANDLTQQGAGFAGDTNIVTLLKRDGSTQTFDTMSKTAVAEMIIDEIVAFLSKNQPNTE